MTLFFLFLFGIIFGSFLNVLILRIPIGKSVAFPSSHCFSCKKPLKWYHNIPVFSWVFLRGKCSFCKSPISIQYPLIELLTGIIFLLCGLKEDILYIAIITSLMFSLLLSLSLIDLRYKAVPDMLSLPALILAIIHPDILLKAEFALLFAGGFALLRIFVSSIMKKEAMGEADIIIAAIIGAVLGISNGLMAIYISAILALFAFLVVSKKEYELPYIPFLAFALFLVYMLDTKFELLVKFIHG